MPVGLDGNPAYSISLPTYNDSVISEFRVDGYVGVHLSPWGDPGKFEGPVDGKGYFRNGECRLNVKFTYSVGFWGPGACGGAYQGLSVDTALIKGQGTLTRGGPIFQYDYECPGSTSPPIGHACWVYGGSETFALNPIFVPIVLTTPGTNLPAAHTILRPPPGTWVVFRVSSNPSTLKSINVPVRVISWHWVPAAGGQGQTIITGGATAIQRSAYIQEDGTMVVDAFVNGVEQVDSISAVTPMVKIQAPDTIRPSIRTPRRTVLDTTQLTITVSGFNQVALRNIDVTLTAIPQEGTGGHAHTGNKPPGDFLPTGGPTKQVNTGAAASVSVTYLAPDPSGPVTIRGTSSLAATGNDTIVIAVPGLIRYFPTQYADTVGGTTTHPYTMNHYVDPAHGAKLDQLAAGYFAKFGVKIKYNDSSLPLGGLFDVGSTFWMWEHKAHREGTNTDIKVQGVSARMRNYMVEQFTKLGGGFCDETVKRDGAGNLVPNTVNPHYHFIYPGHC